MLLTPGKRGEAVYFFFFVFAFWCKEAKIRYHCFQSLKIFLKNIWTMIAVHRIFQYYHFHSISFMPFTVSMPVKFKMEGINVFMPFFNNSNRYFKILWLFNFLTLSSDKTFSTYTQPHTCIKKIYEEVLKSCPINTQTAGFSFPFLLFFPFEKGFLVGPKTFQ